MTPYFTPGSVATVEPTPAKGETAEWEDPTVSYTIQFVENAIYGQPLFPGA
jgi:hypothetical protein